MKFDFSGWATKNDLTCSDGRTIKHNAFKENDGQRVPLVWQHGHNAVDNVLTPTARSTTLLVRIMPRSS